MIVDNFIYLKYWEVQYEMTSQYYIHKSKYSFFLYDKDLKKSGVTLK